MLFLFVVMMLDIDFAELRAGFIKNFPLGIAVALVLLAELVLGLGAYRGQQDIGKQIARKPSEATVNTRPEVGQGVSL